MEWAPPPCAGARHAHALCWSALVLHIASDGQQHTHHVAQFKLMWLRCPGRQSVGYRQPSRLSRSPLSADAYSYVART
jgi:hypothetical protein